MRTTIDLDPLVLSALKERQRRESKTLGVLVSELLSKALAEDESTLVPADFHWPVKSMGALIDVNDKEALWAVLDEPMTIDDVATVDVNVLLHATDAETTENAAALRLIHRMVAGPALITLFWPVLLSYLRIATNPRVYARPLAPTDVVAVIDSLLAVPTVRFVGEEMGMWTAYKHLDIGQSIRGDLVPDAVIVALMLSNGVSTIYTRDRGFRRFDGIKVIDPFTATG